MFKLQIVAKIVLTVTIDIQDRLTNDQNCQKQ